MIIHFKKCSLKTLCEMVNNFYDMELEIKDISLDNKWTPAEINQILFRNFKDHKKALHELVNLGDLLDFRS